MAASLGINVSGPTPPPPRRGKKRHHQTQANQQQSQAAPEEEKPAEPEEEEIKQTDAKAEEDTKKVGPLLDDDWEAGLGGEDVEVKKDTPKLQNKANKKGKKSGKNDKKDKAETDKKNEDPKKKTPKKDVAQKEEVIVESKTEKEEEPMYMDPMAAFNVQSKYRCPIIAILGHVDTGKTKLLDKIRNTNVQSGEAGGITQQIGASFFPQYKLKEEVRKVEHMKINVEVPGLLIIDTPGHESFSNLRSRGSSLCDFAILVVDVMHGLENQTIESIQLLQSRNTPFVICLNKVDRLKDWVNSPNDCSYKSFQKQSGFTRNVFDDKYKPIITELAKQDINGELYWRNDNEEEYRSMVPTSAITGEGVPNILGYIIHYCQKNLDKQITKCSDFKATCLEVKKIEGLGSTIDIILVNGQLQEGDKIVTAGFNGPITTTIRGLLTPQPLKELRVKAEYIHHKQCTGAMGLKLMAPGLETAIAGAAVYKYDSDEELDVYKDELKSDIKRVRKIVKLVNEGVCVAASTLGSLEALLHFLKTKKVPVAEVCIGDVSKEDCIRALTPLLSEENKKKKKEYATILAFDVKILPDATKFAEENGIKIITAKIIYHLTDEFTEHVRQIKLKAKQEEGKDAVFPCLLKIIACFNAKFPLIMGVEVQRGILKPGTPVCVFKDNTKLVLGSIESLEKEKKPVKYAIKSTGPIAIRIKGDKSIQFGRHLDDKDQIISVLTRKSIDC